MTPPRILRVELGRRGYDVAVGVGLLAEVGSRVSAAARSARAVVISDSNVASLYAPAAMASLAKAGLGVDLLEFPAGEPNKNLATYTSLMGRLLELSPPIDRGTMMVALGGGVTGDLAGFVAATALRGIDFVNVPTTLLADVDASVGGKTGVDAPAGKNLVGAFHQPRAVVIDAAVLKSLPRAEILNGLAECVKHAVMADGPMLDWIEDHAAALVGADPGPLAELIARNVAIKAAVVSADEREAGRRAHLNLGHTVGHAIETAAGYGAISHGQAVALGLLAACEISVARGLLERRQADRVREVLSAVGLATSLSEAKLPPEACQPARLQSIMLHDKKARAGVIRFVLPTNLGNVAVFDDVTADQVAGTITGIR